MEGSCLKTTLLSCYKAKMAALSMARPTVHRGAHGVYPIRSSRGSWQKRGCTAEDGGQPHERIHRI
jgi:hypothetical protein